LPPFLSAGVTKTYDGNGFIPKALNDRGHQVTLVHPDNGDAAQLCRIEFPSSMKSSVTSRRSI
jgi:hypothetical protein